MNQIEPALNDILKLCLVLAKERDGDISRMSEETAIRCILRVMRSYGIADKKLLEYDPNKIEAHYLWTTGEGFFSAIDDEVESTIKRLENHDR
jgi:hypothetical protein